MKTMRLSGRVREPYVSGVTRRAEARVSVGTAGSVGFSDTGRNDNLFSFAVLRISSKPSQMWFREAIESAPFLFGMSDIQSRLVNIGCDEPAVGGHGGEAREGTRQGVIKFETGDPRYTGDEVGCATFRSCARPIRFCAFKPPPLPAALICVR